MTDVLPRETQRGSKNQLEEKRKREKKKKVTSLSEKTGSVTGKTRKQRKKQQRKNCNKNGITNHLAFHYKSQQIPLFHFNYFSILITITHV